MLDGSLSRVATVGRTGGAAALADIGLQVLRPVRPMLAATAADVREAIAACGLSSVEWKGCGSLEGTLLPAVDGLTITA